MDAWLLCAWADSKCKVLAKVVCQFRMNEVPDQIFSQSKIRLVRCEGRKSILTGAVLRDVIYRISRIKQPSTLAY